MKKKDIIVISNLSYDEILDFLIVNKSEFESFEVLKGDMDDVFLNVINN